MIGKANREREAITQNGYARVPVVRRRYYGSDVPRDGRGKTHALLRMPPIGALNSSQRYLKFWDEEEARAKAQSMS